MIIEEENSGCSSDEFWHVYGNNDVSGDGLGFGNGSGYGSGAGDGTENGTNS